MGHIPRCCIMDAGNDGGQGLRGMHQSVGWGPRWTLSCAGAQTLMKQGCVMMGTPRTGIPSAGTGGGPAGEPPPDASGRSIYK